MDLAIIIWVGLFILIVCVGIVIAARTDECIEDVLPLCMVIGLGCPFFIVMGIVVSPFVGLYFIAKKFPKLNFPKFKWHT